MNQPFTPEYIAMAKAAEEIQAMRPPFEPGDAVFITQKGWDCQVWVGSVAYDEDDGLWSSYGDVEESKLPAFWLPRLDQLLGMLKTHDDDPIPAFWWYLGEWGYLEYLGEEFKDQAYWDALKRDVHALVLAVVMREKYGKVWRDGAWTKA